MREFNYTVEFKYGMHARPAGKIVTLCRGFNSTVTVITDKGDEANGKRLLSLMATGAKKGDKLRFVIEGEDEEQLETELKALLEKIALEE